MTPEIFKVLVTLTFVLITFYLSYIGMKKTKDIKSFSVGNKDMNPYLIGITMAASISSTATFVINPGFVYTHGLSAYLHYGVAASCGILAAFILITKGFRSIGEANGSLTVPNWIYHRYGSRPLSLFFAFVNLLSITFVVLILVGCAMLLSNLFGFSQTMSLTLTILFVFSYVLMGGTYAHAYTNTFQGILMVVIALFLFFHGLKYFDGGFIESLNSVNTNFSSMYNSGSSLYYSFFSVFFSGFVITFALMLQPHILTKVLYIRKDEDVKKFVITTFVVSLCFSLMLFIGFYAKLAGLEIVAQDQVVTQYILNEFSNSLTGEYLFTFISITLLAAGLSTLDGILVALSAMVVNDIYLPLFGKKEGSTKNALNMSRFTLVIVGIIAYLLALDPPKLVGLFAQKGVYGIAAASIVPILFGVLYKGHMSTKHVSISAIIGIGTHLILNLFMGVKNPAVSSTFGILFSVGYFTIIILIQKISNTNSNTVKVS